MYTCKPGITLLSYMHTYTVYVSADTRLRAAAHTHAHNQQPTLGILMIHAWIIVVFLDSFSPAEE